MILNTYCKQHYPTNVVPAICETVWAELEGPWNAFRNGWSMLVIGDSKSSAEGAPVRKEVEWIQKLTSQDILRTYIMGSKQGYRLISTTLSTLFSKVQTNSGNRIRILKRNNEYMAIINKTVSQDKMCQLLNDTKSQSSRGIKAN